MNILRKIFRFCFALWQNNRQKICWKRQYVKCLQEELVATSHHSFEELSIKNILILCPHADDEWIGCSSLITSNRYKVDVLYYEFYGYDQSVENKTIRDHEIRKCSTIKNFSLHTSSDVSKMLEDLLLSNKYDAVFSPSPIDWHWEHRKVFDTLVNVFSGIRENIIIRIFLYFVSVPPSDDSRLFYYPLNKNGQIEKWAFFNQNYASQRMPNLRYMLQERLNVSGSKHYAAEVFLEISRYQIYKMHDFIHVESVRSVLDSLSKEIDNIYKIRKICKRLKYER